MRTLAVLLSSAALAAAAGQLARDFRETGVVVYTIDGDTFEIRLDSDGSRERVRILGVDTPERERCYYKRAADYTRGRILNQKVELEGDRSQRPRDKYGRVLAYVTLTDGTDFNLDLIQKGYAKAYVSWDRHARQNDYIAAQKEAQAEEIGLWSTCAGNIPFSRY